MSYINLSDSYFNWMCSIAFPNEHIRSHYYNVLNLLHATPFVYSMSLDENRMKDGINLRYNFCYDMNISYEEIRIVTDPIGCSVLEMMVALAIRCENSLMSNSMFGDRTSLWFWNMFVNLGLNKYSNDSWNIKYETEINDIIKRFLLREYMPNGDGSLFKFNDPNIDMRTIEIWDQMNYYMSEIVENDLRIN